MIFAPQYQLKWSNHSTQILSRLSNLLERQVFVDVTLICNGNSLKVHRSVLAACSPYFEHVLQNELGDHPLIVLKDMQFCVLRSLIEFMYYGETHISEENLYSIIEAAKFFEIKGLSEMSIPATTNKTKPHAFTSDNVCIMSGFNGVNVASLISSTTLSTSPSSSPSSVHFSSACTKLTSQIKEEKKMVDTIEVINESINIGNISNGIVEKVINSGENSQLCCVGYPSSSSSTAISFTDEPAHILLSLAGSSQSFYPKNISPVNVIENNVLIKNSVASCNTTSNCELSSSKTVDNISNTFAVIASEEEKFETSLKNDTSSLNSPCVKHLNAFSDVFKTSSLCKGNGGSAENKDIATSPLLISLLTKNLSNQNSILTNRKVPQCDSSRYSNNIHNDHQAALTIRSEMSLEYPFMIENRPSDALENNSSLQWDNPVFVNSHEEIDMVESLDLNDAEVISLTDEMQRQLPLSLSNLNRKYSLNNSGFSKFTDFQTIKSVPTNQNTINDIILENIRQDTNNEDEDPDAVTLFRQNSEGNLEKYVISSKEIEALRLMNERVRKQKQNTETNSTINVSEVQIVKPDKFEKPLITQIIDYKNDSRSLDNIILNRLPFKKTGCIKRKLNSAIESPLDLPGANLMHDGHHHENMLDELNRFRSESSVDTDYDSYDISNRSESRNDSGICRTYYSGSLKDDDEECIMANDDSCDLDMMIEETTINLGSNRSQESDFIDEDVSFQSDMKTNDHMLVNNALECIMNGNSTEPLDFHSNSYTENNYVQNPGNPLLDHEYLFFRKMDDATEHEDSNNSYNISDGLHGCNSQNVASASDVLITNPTLLSGTNKQFDALNSIISSSGNFETKSKRKEVKTNNLFKRGNGNSVNDGTYELRYDIDTSQFVSGKKKRSTAALYENSYLVNNKKSKMFSMELDSDNSLIEEIVFDDLQPVT